MCGILGLASKETILDQDEVRYLRDLMIHRGPDNGGSWLSEDKKIALGHRRLAIIDLNEESNQPMKFLNEELIIVFNGEIYNFEELRGELRALGYNFKTYSDTEVILIAYKEWGADCVKRLNGMFAFSILNKKNNELFLARDRAGEKPLFYSLDSESFIFSSELKPIISYKNHKIDDKSLDSLLSFGYVPGNRSILENVKKLPPANAMVVNLDTFESKIWSYWSLPKFNPMNADTSEEDLLDELEELIENSVKRQLVSDVPVGVLLSGGVDSSLVTAMAARSGEEIRTFTVGFPGFKKYDETKHAKLISEAFNTSHTELSASEPEPEILYDLARQFDEPMIDSSMIPTYLVSKLIKEYCTVALGGDGGDELFGGYSTHSRLLWTHQRAKFIPPFLKRLIAKKASYLPYGFKGREWLRNIDFNSKKGLPFVATHLDSKIRKSLLKNLELGHYAEEHRKILIPETSDLLDRITRMDFQTYLPEDILVKVDRSSMLNSLEIRAPLLDVEIIEFAFSKVHSRRKTSPVERKILLKNLCKRVLPDSFDYNRKQGFSIPLNEWLKKGPWREFFFEALQASKIYDKRIISELLDSQDRGNNNSERLFGLLMFELWIKEYNIKLN